MPGRIFASEFLLLLRVMAKCLGCHGDVLFNFAIPFRLSFVVYRLSLSVTRSAAAMDAIKRNKNAHRLYYIFTHGSMANDIYIYISIYRFVCTCFCFGNRILLAFCLLSRVLLWLSYRIECCVQHDKPGAASRRFCCLFVSLAARWARKIEPETLPNEKTRRDEEEFY